MRKALIVVLFSLITSPALAASAYRLTDNDIPANAQQVVRTSDHASIPNDPRNVDYQAYSHWLKKGNNPDAASTQPPAFGKARRN